MKDCLIVGFNDTSFAGQVTMAKAMGPNSGAYRDFRLSFVESGGQPLRALDVLNSALDARDRVGAPKYHNADLLSPAILYLGSHLTRHGHTFDYVNLFHREKDRLREKLTAGVRTVAITTTLYVSPAPIVEIVSFIRSVDKAVPIILGGPFVSSLSKMLGPDELDQLFDMLGADIYVISQEGEAALAGVVGAIKIGGPLDGVPNIAMRHRDGFRRTEVTSESNPLDENMVDYSLFPAADIGGFVSIRTAKSCPFRCAFCSFPQRAGAYEYLSLDFVERELDALAGLGSVSHISFLDDSFNVPLKRFKEIMRLMIRKNYGFRWNSFLRADHVDDEAIDLMQASGCEGVFLGAESGSDVILKNMAKTSRRHHYADVIPKLRARGILTYTSLILGFPGETVETVAETKQFIEEVQPDFFRAQLWYCDPTTPIWNRREEFNLEGNGFKWRHATMDADEACDLIDQLFVSTRGSTWLPQHGFELWSIFYLRRSGFSDRDIMKFVRSFNDRIKAGLAGSLDHDQLKYLDHKLLQAARGVERAPARSVMI